MSTQFSLLFLLHPSGPLQTAFMPTKQNCQNLSTINVHYACIIYFYYYIFPKIIKIQQVVGKNKEKKRFYHFGGGGRVPQGPLEFPWLNGGAFQAVKIIFISISITF